MPKTHHARATKSEKGYTFHGIGIISPEVCLWIGSFHFRHLACFIQQGLYTYPSTKNLIDGSTLFQRAFCYNFRSHFLHIQHKCIKRFLYVWFLFLLFFFGVLMFSRQLTRNNKKNRTCMTLYTLYFNLFSNKTIATSKLFFYIFLTFENLPTRF